MAGKRFRAEQIIMKLREAEVGLAQGQRVGQVSKQMGVSEQTSYRWRKGYGGHCQRKVARTEFSTDDRELGRPELTPLGECGGAVELEIVS